MERKLICLLMALVVSLGLRAQSVSYAQSLINQGRYLDAAKQLRPLADGGNAEAQVLAAQLFFEGKGVQKSEQQGMKYATMAANQGNQEAVVTIANYYSRAGNNTKAFGVLEKYVQQLNAWTGALGAEYAKYLIQGTGCAKNPVRGYQLMALGGNADSPGWKYLFANAKEYLNTMASENGKTIADYVVGNNDDYGVSKLAAVEMARQMSSYSAQAALFSSFWNYAKNNNAWGMYLVAKFQEEGIGTPKEPAYAKSWYESAKNLGNSWASKEYDRMDQRFWVGEKFKGGETIFWVSDDGKTASVMSVCKILDLSGARQWANQESSWWLPRIDDLKKIVPMHKKNGLKAATCFWSGNNLCQFDENCNLIKTYDINNIPASLGRVHATYIIVNIGKK